MSVRSTHFAMDFQSVNALINGVSQLINGVLHLTGR